MSTPTWKPDSLNLHEFNKSYGDFKFAVHAQTVDGREPWFTVTVGVDDRFSGAGMVSIASRTDIRHAKERVRKFIEEAKALYLLLDEAHAAFGYEE